MDIDREIRSDAHLASLGVKLSKADTLSRYGRVEAEGDADALAPGDSTGKAKGKQPTLGPGIANELPMVGKKAEELPKIGKDEEALARALQKDLRPVGKALATALARGEGPGELFRRLERILAECGTESADVLERAMRSAGTAALANMTDRNGREHADAGSPEGGQFLPKGGGASHTPESTSGSFAPDGGGSGGESGKARKKREKQEKQDSAVKVGTAHMADVKGGKDCPDFMPGVHTKTFSVDHVAFHQGDNESGYVHIKTHKENRKTENRNHQAMLEDGKIPNTLAYGTWFEEGGGYVAISRDRRVVMGKEGKGAFIISAYEEAEEENARTRQRGKRVWNEKMLEGAV